MKYAIAVVGVGAMLALILVVAGCHSKESAYLKVYSITTFSGSEEVPPVQTTASGAATLELSADGHAMHYKITVVDLRDAMMAHLYLGHAWQNGDLIAWLYPAAPPPNVIPGLLTGTLAEGILSATDFMGKMKGKTMSDLDQEIKSGNIYFNIYTKQHPDGELRGQIH